MRAIIQRSQEAHVKIEGRVHGGISHGLVVLLGIEEGDTPHDAEWLVKKITAMRIFADEEGRMNKNIEEADGGFLVISQFTLHATTKKGNRPGFTRAARPDKAIPLYQYFLDELIRQCSRPVAHGQFGANMQIHLINDGPVTIFIDSKNKE